MSGLFRTRGPLHSLILSLPNKCQKNQTEDISPSYFKWRYGSRILSEKHFLYLFFNSYKQISGGLCVVSQQNQRTFIQRSIWPLLEVTDDRRVPINCPLILKWVNFEVDSHFISRFCNPKNIFWKKGGEAKIGDLCLELHLELRVRAQVVLLFESWVNQLKLPQN